MISLLNFYNKQHDSLSCFFIFHGDEDVPAVTSDTKVSYFRPQRSLKTSVWSFFQNFNKKRVDTPALGRHSRANLKHNKVATKLIQKHRRHQANRSRFKMVKIPEKMTKPQMRHTSAPDYLGSRAKKFWNLSNISSPKIRVYIYFPKLFRQD